MTTETTTTSITTLLLKASRAAGDWEQYAWRLETELLKLRQLGEAMVIEGNVEDGQDIIERCQRAMAKRPHSGDGAS